MLLGDSAMIGAVKQRRRLASASRPRAGASAVEGTAVMRRRGRVRLLMIRLGHPAQPVGVCIGLMQPAAKPYYCPTATETGRGPVE
jgi:hypothetical protein